MIRFILNSGGIKNSPDKGARFFAEIVKDLGDNPKILFCFFAEKREDWESKFESYSEGFVGRMPDGVQPILELAFPDKFVNQMKKNDAVYLHGGDDKLLQYWLRQYDLRKIWENKTVATNSASSNAVSRFFWTCDWRRCMDGLGLLPIKFLPHYNSGYGSDDSRGPIDWEAAKKELETYGDEGLPIYAMPEGEYAVLESERLPGSQF